MFRRITLLFTKITLWNKEWITPLFIISRTRKNFFFTCTNCSCCWWNEEIWLNSCKTSLSYSSTIHSTRIHSKLYSNSLFYLIFFLLNSTICQFFYISFISSHLFNLLLPCLLSLLLLQQLVESYHSSIKLLSFLRFPFPFSFSLLVNSSLW